MDEDTDRGFSQAYGRAFARVYNERWTSFSEQLAPQLLHFFADDAEMKSSPRHLLDLCCGTGQLARRFLESGYHVTGIDLSPDMLEYAVRNNKQAVDDGRAVFMVGDAADFKVDGEVSFAVSAFDALNHLPDMDALKSCFASVFAALRSPGLFVFDLNTPKGLERWNGINVHDTQEVTVINRGIYARGSLRAYMSITGFTRNTDGTYERFEEQAYNTAFDVASVLAALEGAGFERCHTASGNDLLQEADGGQLARAFFVCRKT